MQFLSLGDLAQSFQLRRQNAQLKRQLAQLTQAVSTGQRPNLATALTGDFRPLASLESALTMHKGYKTVAQGATLVAGAMQAALKTIEADVSAAGPALVSAATSENAATITTSTRDAKQKLGSVIAALNTRVGERSVFAGTKTDGPAVSGLATLMADLSAAVAGATTADQLIARVDAWFSAPGGGYESTTYRGSAVALAPLRVGEGETVSLSQTALDPAVRQTLEAFSIVALVSDGALAANPAERAMATRKSGEMLLSLAGKMVRMRADVGTAQARIEQISTRNSAEVTSLKVARSGIVGVDQYATATALQSVQNQLQALYLITARVSRLSLTEFLR